MKNRFLVLFAVSVFCSPSFANPAPTWEKFMSDAACEQSANHFAAAETLLRRAIANVEFDKSYEGRARLGLSLRALAALCLSEHKTQIAIDTYKRSAAADTDDSDALTEL